LGFLSFIIITITIIWGKNKNIIITITISNSESNYKSFFSITNCYKVSLHSEYIYISNGMVYI